MIDEKINNSLRELEQGLKNVESARKQVEKTVSSYDGLNKTTAEYVSQLGVITTKVKELVDSIGKDYDQKVKAFEKAEQSDFLKGKSGKFKASFDWIMKAANFIKVLEGNYDNRADGQYFTNLTVTNQYFSNEL